MLRCLGMKQPAAFTCLSEALLGIEIPESIQQQLELITVPYLSFTNESREGQLVVNKEVAREVEEIFALLREQAFPIYSIKPVCVYGWDDDASMEANNTSAFNYRCIIGTDQLSTHSYGYAIDINPLQNPYHARDGKIYPSGASYVPSAQGTLTESSLPVRLFKERGWLWLGEREQNTDYQHFQKMV